MNKSYVTMEQNVCPVCCKSFDTGSLLLDTRMRETFDRHTTTGMAPCPECQKLADDGYVALIGCEPPADGADTTSPADAVRTGDVIHMRREVFAHMFSAAPPESFPMVFIEPEVVDMIKAHAAGQRDDVTTSTTGDAP